jgi:hypothetical protein
MKVLFICSSCEPGRDGVGDYTRRLALALDGCGHHTVRVGMNDRHAGNVQVRDGALAAVPKLIRFPESLSWKQRFATLRDLDQEFAPDCISLQYVPHGFQAKGLPFRFALGIAPFAHGRRVHITFHELWGGASNILGRTIIPALQKQLLLYLCRTLSPRVVNVTNEEYQRRLASIGIASAVLPLFGNIPVLVKASAHKNADEWVFAIFGTLRAGWKFERLLVEIECAREVAAIKRCRFVSVGRLGEHGQSLWEAMKRSGYENFVFERLGELEESDVSRALHSADFGIAVSPFEIIEKSGAVAAMREHGLPVIVTQFRPETARSLVTGREGLVLLNDDFQESLRAAKRLPCRESLPQVAQCFIDSLKAAE